MLHKIGMSFAALAVMIVGALALGACEEPGVGMTKGASSPGGGSECVSDKDCKGNRICENGACVSPR